MKTSLKALAAALLVLPLITFAAATAASGSSKSATKPAKPQRVAMGQQVQITDYLVPGKTVVFDFYSDFCPPCVRVAPALDKLHARREDIVVVKVDINRPGTKGIDWQSPVAKQYGLRSIPHFKVYGPDGKLLAEDSAGGSKARDMVMAWIN